jgi:hypothetical protein
LACTVGRVCPFIQITATCTISESDRESAANVKVASNG